MAETIHGDLDTQLSQLELRLVEEYERTIDADRVRKAIEDEREQYADAKVLVFVPILIERGVRRRLAATA